MLDFCLNANYVHAMKWPDDYWPPAAPADAQAWDNSVAGFKADRERLKDLARDETIDLHALVPKGTGHQTYLRAILLMADHNAYHLGQIVAVRRAFWAFGNDSEVHLRSRNNPASYGGQPPRDHGAEVVDPAFASWNQAALWLRQIQGLRPFL